MAQFASTQDVEARLGRELTDAEEDQYEYLIEAASAVITEAIGKSEAWAEDLDPVPNLLRIVATDVAIRARGNPTGARSEQETLGVYSHSTSYKDDGGGLWLSSIEQLLVRRATNGGMSGSVQVDSLVYEHELS